MSSDNYETRLSRFEAGEIAPDGLFEPVFQDAQTPEPVSMSVWDSRHSKRLESLKLPGSTSSQEENLRLSAVVQRGSQADFILATDPVELDVEQYQHFVAQSKAGKVALETAIASNFRLVEWFVRATMGFHRSDTGSRGGVPRGVIIKDLATLCGGDLDYSDRIQIATIGLIQAFNSYTGLTTKGKAVYFSTWALVSMENELLKQRGHVQSPVSVPIGINGDARRFHRIRGKLDRDGAHNPSYDELYQAYTDVGLRDVDLPELDKLNQIKNMMQPLSWEVLRRFTAKKIAENSDIELREDDEELFIDEILADDGIGLTVGDEAINYLLTKTVNEMVFVCQPSPLTNREKEILGLRFGLDANDSLTLEDISHVFGVSAERIRQILTGINEKLRDNYQSTKLLDIRFGFADEDPRFGLRSEFKLDEFDSEQLGLQRYIPIPSPAYQPLTRYAGAEALKRYTYEELAELDALAAGQSTENLQLPLSRDLSRDIYQINKAGNRAD